MSDSKSKMPDLNEIGSIAGKLFKDIKKSVSEIISDYKQQRPAEPVKPSDPIADAKPEVVAEVVVTDTAQPEVVAAEVVVTEVSKPDLETPHEEEIKKVQP